MIAIGYMATCSLPAVNGLPEAISALRRHEPIGDEVFDQIYPGPQRCRSWLHWTPIEVALRACELLAPTQDLRVLDVGSGVGKLCLVGALTSGATWFGIERDAEMVRIATDAARMLGVDDRAHFVHGELEDIAWAELDAFYLFNPFGEALLGAEQDALARRDTFVASVVRVQRLLATTRPGTRVVTYHGFGGDLPHDFELVVREPAHEDELCLWIKRSPGA